MTALPPDPITSDPRTRTTAEPVVRATAEHSTTAEHTAARATPLGGGPIRGGKSPGLRLFGVASLEQAGGATPLVTGTQLVTFRDIGAVVVPAAYASETLTPRELEAYCDVVAQVFARHAIVPAPPGAVFRSRERLLGWLELHYYTLAEALDFVTERVVARVTVHRGDPNTVASEANEVPPAPLPPTSLRLTPTLEDDARPHLASDLVALAADAFRELRREAVALIVLRAGPDAARPDDAAHGSFLIDRSRWQAFTEAVAVQGRRHAALRLECTGPWPPYDFVRMQLTG